MSGRARVIVLASAGLSLAIACGLDAVGEGPAPAADAGVDAKADASLPPIAEDDGGDDGAIVDGGVDVTIPGDGACLPAEYDDGGRVAYAVYGDGAAPRCESFVVSLQTAAREITRDAGDVAAVASVSIEWNELGLHVVATVKDPTPYQGNDDAQPYHDDSMELYLSPGPLEGTYGPNDVQLITDYKGLAYRYSPYMPDTPYDASTAEKTPDGYRLEWLVPVSILGGTLDAGRELYVDMLLNDGVNQSKYIIWSNAPHACDCDACGCATGDVTPHADTYLFSPLFLR